MKRANVIDTKGIMVTGATSSKRSYQLRGPATTKPKRSPPTNKISVQGGKKLSTNNSDQSHENATSDNSMGSDTQANRTRRSSMRLGSRNTISNVGGVKTRTKRTIPDNNRATIGNKKSKTTPLPSSPPPPPSSSPPPPSPLPSALSPQPTNDMDDVVDNGRKVRGSKSIIRDSKNGVGNSNHINGSHNNNDHDNIVEDTDPIDSSDDKTDTNSSTKPKTKRIRTKRRYICNFCDKEFLGGNDLRKHIRIHTDERPFECQHCGQRFRQGGCLKNHIASQHGTSETFTCYYCNKSFPIKERLRLHMRLHSGEKPYHCKICFKRFARGGQLTQHLASHSGVKKYRCTQCSNSFSCSVNLKLHVKSHLNVRDYTCHLCGKSFVRPDALKKHLTCFHENVKAFFCSICSRTFKGHLPQHMRTHENVKSHGCANCGATFSQKSQLIVHQRIHSGERPYRCQVCWQAFAHSSVLKLHIRKHTGEKPFKCSVCKDTETAFSQLPHLKTHMRAIHGMDKVYHCEFCSEYFKTKHELQEHKIKCSKAPKVSQHQVDDQFGGHHATVEPKCSTKETTLSRMRLLIAVLLKKISSQDRLKQLGFDKRLIDNVLMDALKMAGQDVVTDTKLHEVERLRANVKIFLDWSIPDTYMKKFKNEQRSTEELLEDLTSNFNRQPKKA